MSIDTDVMTPTQQRFADAFGKKFKIEASLSRYTSARVGGPAEMLVVVNNAQELKLAAEMAYAEKIPYFVLGGGSNILVADQGIRGLVIFNKAKKVSFRHTGTRVVCTVESGMNLSSLTRQCIGKGLGGLEWAIGVPGTVGGAVVGNSGAHGGDMSDNVTAVQVWEPGKGVRTYTIDELEYGYRTSILKREQGKLRPRRVVLTAELQFKPESVEVLMARADAFTEKRKATQPGGASMGSMFKNPENYHAGYLLDAAGLKGFRSGHALISDKHANFFINEKGQATAEDIRALIAEAWHTVRDRFGVELDLEVELVGNWEFEK